jgi:SAM-dependent methyltransferase
MLHDKTGYTTDLEYECRICAEMDPHYLAYVCAIRGVDSVLARLADGIDYCDLGCGSGDSVLAMAAAHPSSRFTGIDFNPAHIARAQAIARRAGLTNARFIECSFADFSSRSDTTFDVIALHGVYSWVGAEQRNEIVASLSAKLRSGGIVYVSYNVLPGWLSMLPLRQIMIELARQTELPSSQKVAHVRKFIREFAEIERACGYSSRHLDDLCMKLEKTSANYIAHEYLNRDWYPAFSNEVARDLHRAKLSFVGEATIHRNYPETFVPTPMVEFIERQSTPELQQLLTDISSGATFRRDVFVRGMRRSPVRHLLESAPFSFLALDRILDIGEPVADIASFAAFAELFVEHAFSNVVNFVDILSLAAQNRIAAEDCSRLVQALVAHGLLQIGHGTAFGALDATSTECKSMSALNCLRLQEAAMKGSDALLCSNVVVKPVQVSAANAQALANRFPISDSHSAAARNTDSVDLKREFIRKLSRLRIIN